MLDRIFSLFKTPEASTPEEFASSDIAVAALLIRAAMADADFNPQERAVIRHLLAETFHFNEVEIERLIARAELEESNTVDLHRWTQAIKQNHDEAARIALIEKMWEVVYADGRLDDYEANLLRRVAGLIYVPDRASGEARKRVLARLEKRREG